MINEKTMQFKNWTEYDDWLVENYEGNAIYKVNEVDGHIEIAYCEKAEFQAEQKRLEEEKAKAAKA